MLVQGREGWARVFICANKNVYKYHLGLLLNVRYAIAHTHMNASLVHIYSSLSLLLFYCSKLHKTPKRVPLWLNEVSYEKVQ